MAKFDAGKAVPRLDYDFQAFKLLDADGNPTDQRGPTGIIGEPSDEQINRFQYDFSALLTEITGHDVDPTDNKSVQAAMYEIGKDIDLLREVTGRSAEIVAALCSNPDPNGAPTKVTVDMLHSLPGRVQNAFYGWLQGELNPNS